MYYYNKKNDGKIPEFFSLISFFAILIFSYPDFNLNSKFRN